MVSAGGRVRRSVIMRLETALDWLLLVATGAAWVYICVAIVEMIYS